MPESTLVLNVKSDSVAKASDRLDRLDRESRQAAKGSAALGKESRKASADVGALAAKATAAFAALKGLQGLFSDTVKLQQYRARLKTATGSVEDAAQAFNALQEFASETPFAMEQSIDAFVKLVNLGLTPSEEALRSYGNTAAAMGRDLNQMIEAVADATTGEFERLKEFGIKASSEGERVRFTFRGVTTEIGKNASEIERYLQSIGNEQFASAMSDQMDTLGGRVSNLRDNWQRLKNTIIEAGLDQIFEGFVNTVNDAINMLHGLSAAIGPVVEDVGEGFGELGDWIYEALKEPIDDIFGDSGELFRAMKAVPITFAYWIKQAAVELWRIAITVKEIGVAMVETFKLAFESILDLAIATGDGIWEALWGDFSFEGFNEELRKVGGQLDDITDRVFTNTEAAIQGQREALQQLQEEYYNSLNELSGGGSGGGGLPDTALPDVVVEGSQGGGNSGGGRASAVREAVKLRLDILYEGYELEKQQLLEFYEERRQLILENELVTEEQRHDLLMKEAVRRGKDLAALERVQHTEQLGLYSNFLGDLSSASEAFGKRGAKAAKALAIVQGGIDAAIAFNKAFTDPTPMPTPLRYAMAAAATASVVANTAKIASAGNFEQGGIVPGSSYSGDHLTANVNSGEMILNRTQQARLFDIANRGTSGNVTIINQTTSPVEAETVNEAGRMKIVIREAVDTAKAELANEINTGGGQIAPILENTYQLRRGQG